MLRTTWARRRPIGAALVVLGLFGSGSVVGWSIRDRQEAPVERIEVTVERQVTATDDAADVAAAAPNVLGLDEATARQVLFDAGLLPDRLEVEAVPAAGPPDVVVRQTPPPGVPVTDTMTLGISESTTVPDLSGSSVADARALLTELGVRPVVRAVYQPGAVEDTVLGSQPAPGEPLTVDVQLTVAGPPSSVFLAQLRPIEGRCSTGDDAIDGTAVPSSVQCSPSNQIGDVRSTEYLVNRLVDRFEMTLGQSDTSEPGTVIRVVVRADGTTTADETFSYGESRQVSADITGALRLTIDIMMTEQPDRARTPSVVLGSARLVGGPDAIEELISPGD